MNFFKRILRKEPKDVIAKWILSIEAEQSIPSDIVALNFGLYEPFGIELIGSRHYDENDDDWACNEDYVPNTRGISLNISDDTEWQTVLDNTSKIIKDLMNKNPTLKLWQVDHITIGFSDGDLVKLK